MLSEAELARVRTSLTALQPHWRILSRGRGLYILGYASYIDAIVPVTQADYYRSAPAMNAVLRGELDWFYHRLLDTLATLLAAPVRYRNGCALPGFHIFVGGAVEEHKPSIHIDKQFEHLRWEPGDEADFARTISFTLAIELPASGAGLRMWDEQQPPYAPFDDLQQFLGTYEDLPSHVQLYTPGHLVLHSGNTVHQLVMGDRSPGQHRITLQGHGVWCPDGFHLYW